MNEAEARVLVDELILRAEVAMAEALNLAAGEIYIRSQVEVPKGLSDRDLLRHGATLEDSGFAPDTDPEFAATPGKMEAVVGYDHPAALAQEAGKMLYERDGKEIDWEARNYTTEGTKAHFLADPLKAKIATLESEVGAAVEAAIGGSPGTSLRTTGPLSAAIRLG